MQTILFTDVSETLGYGKYAGTYKVATEIRRHGYSCQVIDLFTWYSDEQLVKICEKFITKETLLVGFSATLLEKRNTPDGIRLLFGKHLSEMEKFWDYIHSLNPNCKIVIGGSMVNINSGWKQVDYVIFNKADNAIIKLIEHLKFGNDIKISNVVEGTKVINGEDYFYTQDQFANDVLKFTKSDIVFPGEALPLEIARGCIFSCAFCRFDLIGKRVGDWQRNYQSLYNEIIYNYENFGTTHAMISDELINESIDKLIFLNDLFSKLPFKFTYSGFARVDLIWRYPEMRDLLLSSGANGIIFGVETLNDKVGRTIGKGMASDKIKETLQYCREAWKDKIVTRGNFIVGLPGETEESIWKTFEYLTSDQNPLDTWDFMPLLIIDENIGKNTSKIDRDPKKYGYIKIDSGWQNENMSRKDAERIARSIYRSNLYKTKNKLSLISWIGRMHNIGYSVEDLFKIRDNNEYSKETWAKDMEKLMFDKKQLYYQELLKL